MQSFRRRFVSFDCTWNGVPFKENVHLPDYVNVLVRAAIFRQLVCTFTSTAITQRLSNSISLLTHFKVGKIKVYQHGFSLLSNGISSLVSCLFTIQQELYWPENLDCLTNLFSGTYPLSTVTLLLKWKKRYFPCQYSAVCTVVDGLKNSWEPEVNFFLPGQKLNCWKIEFRWKCRSVDRRIFVLSKNDGPVLQKRESWRLERNSYAYLT